MESPRCGSMMICSVALVLDLVAGSACIAAEFKRAKVGDMKLDGKMCYLPRSAAFGLGIAALICLSSAQVVGNFGFVKRIWSRDKKEGNKGGTNSMAIALLLLSWISFGLTIMLLGVGTSMNQRQPYGEGWLDGECYVVKAGVYVGAAILALATLIFLLAFNFSTTTRHSTRRQEQEARIHAHELRVTEEKMGEEAHTSYNI